MAEVDPIDREIEEANEYAWLLLGACRGSDPAVFFPTRGETTDEAQEACRACDVRSECLEYAIAHRIEHGTWGGASERERRRIIRARRRGAA